MSIQGFGFWFSEDGTRAVCKSPILGYDCYTATWEQPNEGTRICTLKLMGNVRQGVQADHYQAGMEVELLT